MSSAIPTVARGTKGVTIAKKNSPARIRIAPTVTGSIRLRSAVLPREESAVVARSPVTYVCSGSLSLDLSWEMMFCIVTMFFNIGSESAEPNEPGACEKLTRMIIAFLLGLMKFWRITDGISGGYCERVSCHTVRFANDCAVG